MLDEVAIRNLIYFFHWDRGPVHRCVILVERELFSLPNVDTALLADKPAFFSFDSPEEVTVLTVPWSLVWCDESESMFRPRLRNGAKTSLHYV